MPYNNPIFEVPTKMFYTSLSKFEIGNLQQWIQISDHMSIFIEIKDSNG